MRHKCKRNWIYFYVYTYCTTKERGKKQQWRKKETSFEYFYDFRFLFPFFITGLHLFDAIHHSRSRWHAILIWKCSLITSNKITTQMIMIMLIEMKRRKHISILFFSIHAIHFEDIWIYRYTHEPYRTMVFEKLLNKNQIRLFSWNYIAS